MTGKQSAVLWIGIILIALNLVKNWSQIKAVIFTGPASQNVNQPWWLQGSSLGGQPSSNPIWASIQAEFPFLKLIGASNVPQPTPNSVAV